MTDVALMTYRNTSISETSVCFLLDIYQHTHTQDYEDAILSLHMDRLLPQ